MTTPKIDKQSAYTDKSLTVCILPAASDPTQNKRSITGDMVGELL
jgi:hypothetical protein